MRGALGTIGLLVLGCSAAIASVRPTTPPSTNAPPPAKATATPPAPAPALAPPPPPSPAPVAAEPAPTAPRARPRLEHFRAAIENYIPAVRLQNQRALGGAVRPFAQYLISMHARVHPLFVDDLLHRLDALPVTHPMNDRSLAVKLELVLGRQDGRLVRLGVVRSSGLTAFDVQALWAFEQAAPYGPAPEDITSTDGNIYLHWTLRRDEASCSVLNAEPFLLAVAAPAAPPQSLVGPDL
jgi:hypothetical protein